MRPTIPSRSPWQSCATALVFIAVAALLRLWPLQVLVDRLPWLTFYPAVMMAALYGGVAAGMLGTALSLVAVLWLLPPFVHHSLVKDAVDWLGAAVFAGTCAAFSWLTRGTIGRKKAEAALRLQSAALEAAANGIVITDRDGVIEWANPAFLALSGYSLAEAIGRNPRDLVKSGRHDQEFYRHIWETILAGKVWRGEIVNRRKDGTFYTEEMTITPVRAESGEISQFIAIKQDVTERRQSEEVVLRTQRLQSLGMLASGIAHDLNNMLAPIILVGPLLREHLSAPHDLKILDALERSAERGTGLVRQILAFAHGTAGELKLIQAKHVARDIVGMLEATFPKSIQIDQNVLSNAWTVIADATQIHQVLLNLCINARDAMPRGGTLRIGVTNCTLTAEGAKEIHGARAGDWLVLEVGDTGTGIAPDVLPHIWEPFFTTKGEGKGSGLGLSTLRGIVDRHFGFIELLTTVGQGTTVRVYLPAVKSTLPPPSDAAPPPLFNGSGELVLIVDDNRAVRETLDSILTKHGYRAMQAVDGVDAIKAFTAHFFEIALAVIDVDMPALNGAAVARALLRLRPSLPLIAMSGLESSDTDGADVREARKLTRAFLPKPFTANDLLSTVHHVLHPPEKT
ncbi:MAG: ATP-binding protein [Opitutaceae bacterium]|jgi:PAS domain S-box-containing protein